MIWPIVVLSLVQGLTEFLPISSSGHLAILRVVWQIPLPGLLFEALVHLGTLLAVLWIFRWRVGLLLRAILPSPSSVGAGRAGDDDHDRGRREHLRLLGLILLGTVPTAILGLLLDPWIEKAFSSLLVVGLDLLLTGGFLLLVSQRWRGRGRAARTELLTRRGLAGIGPKEALLIGLAQGVAILPGISRSGLTIGVGLLLGLEWSAAAEFSFLLAGPAIFGATALKGLEALREPAAYGGLLGLYLLGTALAAATGGLAIKSLLGLLRRGRLAPFAYYCLVVGSCALLLSLR